MMDVRIGGLPSSMKPIQLTSPDPDSNPAGSQGGWTFDNQTSQQKPHRGTGFAAIADGPKGAQPSGSEDYLTAMYVQYVDYRGPRRGTVDNPLVPMTLAEGSQIDYRV